jgi:hypothetical protein
VERKEGQDHRKKIAATIVRRKVIGLMSADLEEDLEEGQEAEAMIEGSSEGIRKSFNMINLY